MEQKQVSERVSEWVTGWVSEWVEHESKQVWVKTAENI